MLIFVTGTGEASEEKHMISIHLEPTKCPKDCNERQKKKDLNSQQPGLHGIYNHNQGFET